MNLEERPDAIFTATDQITTRCLAILNKFNYKIPEQVAIIGFTNTDLAEALNPSLSTVHQPAFEIGVQAAQKLISLIESRYKVTEFETIVLDTVLMVRDSTRNRLRG
ncbi:substrate-binding domain-containing protein [Pedobacter sp. PWIIR3]